MKKLMMILFVLSSLSLPVMAEDKGSGVGEDANGCGSKDNCGRCVNDSTVTGKGGDVASDDDTANGGDATSK